MKSRVSLERVVDMVATNPRRIWRLDLPAETYTLVDLEAKYIIEDEQLLTKSGFSPFAGKRVKGKVLETWIRGTKVYDGEQVLVEARFRAKSLRSKRMNLLRQTFLKANAIGYRALRPVIFRKSAQAAHAQLLNQLERADASAILCGLADTIHNWSFPKYSLHVGGALLNHPFILAAGFVKGRGFTSEDEALFAVQSGRNIIPGWKSVPKLVGIVEFGSFTRQPRMGNAGTVIWRDAKSQSTQNRVGLKNPRCDCCC